MKEGDRFGKLIVVKEAQKRKNLRYWVVKCECGTEKEIFQGSLTRLKGNSTSCGCAKSVFMSERVRIAFGQSAKNKRIFEYKKKARKSGKEFLLTNDQFFYITQQSCHYCGILPYRSSLTKGTHHYGDFVYNGVDRINSDKGYTIDNCVPCCRMCNMGKLDSSYQEFIDHLNQICRFRGGNY